MAKTILNVNSLDIRVIEHNSADYISLTDLARYKDNQRSDYILQNWLRNRSTIEFVGLWEIINNENFNSIEFDGIKNQSGTNSFVLTPKYWIEATNAIGLISKAGRYGGTYAHKDIAFEFATWLSAEFKLYLIKEFQRLKEAEKDVHSLTWDVNRILAKVNYKIHTDAIKEFIVPNMITKQQISKTYADEADVLNLALFGKTALQWRIENPDLSGNMRDYASIEQLIILANLESLNSELIRLAISQTERLQMLNKTAIFQLNSLLNNTTIKKLELNDG